VHAHAWLGGWPLAFAAPVHATGKSEHDDSREAADDGNDRDFVFVLLRLGPGRKCSKNHKMEINSRNKGLKSVEWHFEHFPPSPTFGGAGGGGGGGVGQAQAGEMSAV
jgi:hypothetical protein